MHRIKDDFTKHLCSVINLTGKQVLEIGSGYGRCTAELGPLCSRIVGIEPLEERVSTAQLRKIPRSTFLCGRAEILPFRPETFDLTLFTLSLHHVDPALMNQAIEEARKVTKKEGRLIFLEPDHTGSYYEAEIEFDAGDGDERIAKRLAEKAMMEHKGIIHKKEILDEAVFVITSEEAFRTSMIPKKNLGKLSSFLEAHRYTLRAMRRINIFDIRS